MAANTLADVVRYCPDIGLWVLDRPATSCIHRTTFCARSCYNVKLYKLFPRMAGKDTRSETAWVTMSAATVAALFDKLERSPRFQRSRRLRLMTRGEAFSTADDIARVHLIAKVAHARGVKVWAPTRSWRDSALWPHVRYLGNTFADTLYIMASTDPSTPHGPEDGSSTMFFGDDGAVAGRYRCPKTHDHATGACATCTAGCFSSERVGVHLKSH